MEQKKTLWIVAAAGIFLLVVVGAALIIYSPSLHNAPVQQAFFDPSTGWVNASAMAEPKDAGEENSAFMENTNKEADDFAEQSSSSNFPSSPFDPLAQNQNLPGVNSQRAEMNGSNSSASGANTGANAVINAQNVNVYAQETTTFDLNALKAVGAASSRSTAVTAQNEKTADELAKAAGTKTEDRTAAANYYTPSSSSRTAEAKSSSLASSASSKSSAVKNDASANAKTKDSQKSSSAAKKVAEASKAPSNIFWVQVGAYSSKKNADSARETLEQNKIPVEVFTDGKYYKVRAGSFTTKSEAVYWQKMISEIGRFADAKTMVVNSAVQK